MISRAQQILIKMGQRQCGLDDMEYREALALVSGCRSSTDPKLTDRGVDLIMAYMESIYWLKVDKGELCHDGSATAPFRQRQRNYWSQKNPKSGTSRDRYSQSHPSTEIADLEAQLGQLGFGTAYCDAIRERATAGRNDTAASFAYRAALQRTLAAKRKKAAAAVDAPF